jgi:hypothetical protein
MDLDGGRLIRLPIEDSKANYIGGFWRWVEVLATDDYQRALESLYWPRGTAWTPEQLKKRITTFFGGDSPWSVVVPNTRLIGVVNDSAEFHPPYRDRPGWFLAQIPLTTKSSEPKADDIPLMGLASSFYVRPFGGHYVLEHENFHV